MPDKFINNNKQISDTMRPMNDGISKAFKDLITANFSDLKISFHSILIDLFYVV